MSYIISLFQQIQALSDETVYDLERIIKEKECEKGTMLVRMEQVPEYFYFIVKGLARVYYVKDDHDITDYFAIDQQFIGALPALFSQTPTYKAIEILEQSRIEYFPYITFDQLCAKHHDLERAARKMTVIGMLEGQKRIESIRFFSARERYDELEKLYPGISNRAPLKDIASYLGVTQVSLSRIRAGKQ